MNEKDTAINNVEKPGCASNYLFEFQWMCSRIQHTLTKNANKFTSDVGGVLSRTFISIESKHNYTKWAFTQTLKVSISTLHTFLSKPN